MRKTFERETSPVVEEFAPNSATEAAWEARSHLLRFRESEIGSTQAEQARELANRAFGEVVTLTEPQLFASAMQRTSGDSEAVSEILQETYLRSYKGLAKFRGDCQVETWLHSIMFRQLSSYYKDKSKRLGHMVIGNFEDSREDDSVSIFEIISRTKAADLDIDNPGIAVEREEIRGAVIDEIEQLPPKLGEVVKLRYLYEMTHEKIAEVLQISVPASKVRLHRALGKLKSSNKLRSLFGKGSADDTFDSDS